MRLTIYKNYWLWNNMKLSVNNIEKIVNFWIGNAKLIDEFQMVNREKDDDLRNIREQYEDKIALIHDEIQNQKIKTTQDENQVYLIMLIELKNILIDKGTFRIIKVI